MPTHCRPRTRDPPGATASDSRQRGIIRHAAFSGRARDPRARRRAQELGRQPDPERRTRPSGAHQSAPNGQAARQEPLRRDGGPALSLRAPPPTRPGAVDPRGTRRFLACPTIGGRSRPRPRAVRRGSRDLCLRTTGRSCRGGLLTRPRHHTSRRTRPAADHATPSASPHLSVRHTGRDPRPPRTTSPTNHPDPTGTSRWDAPPDTAGFDDPGRAIPAYRVAVIRAVLRR